MTSKKDGAIQEAILEAHQVENNLGMSVDYELSFRNHIAKSKANRIVGIIRQTFDFISEELFVHLYKCLVRPLLKYGHSEWQPQHKILCNDIENVQRRATKLVLSVCDKPYQERLATLKLPSLEHRRRRGDMIDLYKYMHRHYNTDRQAFKTATKRHKT